MPYFDEAPAKFGETKEKNTVVLEDNTTENRNVDERLLRLKMKQLVQKEFFHQLEPVEVIEIEEERNGNKFGNIIGRYIYSEYNISKGDARSNGSFKPINSNILQMPLPGEIVVGLEFNDERYYFSALNPSTEIINNDKQTINQSVSDEENNTTPVEEQTDFENISNNKRGKRNEFRPGDTLIQGRHNNYIHLSSRQFGKGGPDSGNILIGALNNDKGGSEIQLISSGSNSYPLAVDLAGLSMNKSKNGRSVLSNRDQFVANRFSEPSIFMNSDRIVLHARSEDIAIFATKGNVHIKGTKVQIRNSRQVSLSANEVVNETKKLYRLKEDLASGNVLLLPEGVVERGRTLAEKHQENILLNDIIF